MIILFQITTVPSFVNELSRHISILKSIACPIVICVTLYIIIGLTGASSFKINQSTDILATLRGSNENRVLITIANILFPVSVLVTSVPVFAIVIRYNLVRGNFCSNSKWHARARRRSEFKIDPEYAIVWASVMPWIFIIPFQTKVCSYSLSIWHTFLADVLILHRAGQCGQ
jgi:amino acid permease